jgi:hypothetical protein
LCSADFLKWSYEWKQLAPLLKNKEHYIPIVFYPAYKQSIQTENLESSLDRIPKNQSGFSFKDELSVHSIIILNAVENRREQIPILADLYHDGRKISQIKPFYKTDASMRFIYFLCDRPNTADSIAFLNYLYEPAVINTHVRIVSYKKTH